MLSCPLEIFSNVSNVSISSEGALIDRGANGAIARADIGVINKSDCQINIRGGVDNHQVRNLKIVSCGGTITPPDGDFIAIFNKYAFMP